MGWNTTIVVMNDALDQIKKDALFGSKLAAAVSKLSIQDGPIDISAGNHCNAAHAVEQHHADCTSIVTVGGNLGIKQMICGGWKHNEELTQIELCKRWAEKLGYRLSKIPKRG